MNNMAVASRSSSADARDARVPCTHCGGLVHPIAGRCKHCKADLAALRSARPQAAAALPPLARSGNPPPAQVLAPAPIPQDVVALPVHAQPTQIGATPIALVATQASIEIPRTREAYNPIPDGRPILPPRPTGRMRASGDERGWLARNWPVFVIILASIAIILAVILMVWPKSEPADAGTKNPGVGPAPERMETNPLPPPSADPWQNGQPPSANPVPSPPTPPVAPPPDDPDDQTMIDPIDPFQDPFTSPGGGGGLSNGSRSVAFILLSNIANRLCDKAKTCSDPAVATMCASMSAFPRTPLPPSCPQAKRCMDIVDQIDVCGGALSAGIGGPNFPQIMMRTSDCMDALTRC